MSIAGESDYRRVLKREFDNRCARAQLVSTGTAGIPRPYSLRAFARDLGLAPSRLSEILSGKQGLSREAARRIGSAIGLAKQELEIFCDLVESEHARAQIRREIAKSRVERHRLDSAYRVVEMDAFQAVSEWYHFAILQLISVTGFQDDPRWIAKQLGITLAEANDALSRLERLELIGRQGGELRVLQEFTSTAEGVPSSAIRKAHRHILMKAVQALDEQSVEERDVSALILPVDQRRLPEAKRWLKLFRRRFSTRLHHDPQKTALYCLSLQFFRLDAGEKPAKGRKSK